MQIKKNDFVVIDIDTRGPESSPSSKEKSKDGGGFAELESPPENVEAPDYDPTSDSGETYQRKISGGLSGERTKAGPSTAAIGKGGSEKQAEEMWKNAVSSALSSGGGGLSDKARSLVTCIEPSAPRVDWKKELNAFMDENFEASQMSPWARSGLGQDTYVYGLKTSGEDAVDILVLPVDTSGSISRPQIEEFVNEVWNITTQFRVKTVYIIYTSDDIDSVDIIEEGGEPDLSMIYTTGGNAKGFLPPFDFMQSPRTYEKTRELIQRGRIKYDGKKVQNANQLPRKIDPTAVIYFTDTQATYPSPDQFDINKYKNRVFWFICASKWAGIKEPTFGRKLFVTIDGPEKDKKIVSSSATKPT